jgi:prepilin-type N-terminal cleavage/methylation domain-containing protein
MPETPRAELAREDGFTMIELLVSITLLGVLFAAFSLVLGSTMTQSRDITNQSVLQVQARAAVDELTRDLRQAIPPDTTATSPFVTASTMSPTSITFYSPDRLYTAGSPTSYHLNEISYQLSNGDFQRAFATSSDTDGAPWTIPALGSWVTRIGSVVNTDVFTYYDASGALCSNCAPASVRTVVVKLTISDPTGHGRTYTYSSSATLRVTG